MEIAWGEKMGGRGGEKPTTGFRNPTTECIPERNKIIISFPCSLQQYSKLPRYGQLIFNKVAKVEKGQSFQQIVTEAMKTHMQKHKR